MCACRNPIRHRYKCTDSGNVSKTRIPEKCQVITQDTCHLIPPSPSPWWVPASLKGTIKTHIIDKHFIEKQDVILWHCHRGQWRYHWWQSWWQQRSVDDNIDDDYGTRVYRKFLTTFPPRGPLFSLHPPPGPLGILQPPGLPFLGSPVSSLGLQASPLPLKAGSEEATEIDFFAKVPIPMYWWRVGSIYIIDGVVWFRYKILRIGPKGQCRQAWNLLNFSWEPY